MSESYVTVATDDITCLGCLVLCNSLKQTGTEKKISVLVYPNVSQNLRNVLHKSFDYVFYVKDLFISNRKEDVLNDLKEFQKLKCWLLTQFTKCIFLESDVLVVENIDDLFERHELSAVADPRWPDSFDAGVFVYEPNIETYLALIDYSLKNKFKDNSIQELLNLFFSKWNVVSIQHKIPFLYNCQLNSTFYTHSNALLHFGRSIKAARLGNSVWDMMESNILQDVNHDNWNRLWLLWWKIFNEMVKPSLTVNEIQDFNRINWSNDKFHDDEKSSTKDHCTSPQSQVNKTSDKEHKETPTNDTLCSIQKISDLETHIQHNTNENVVTNPSILSEPNMKEEMENNHRQQWERGEIDYMGKDSFQNILSKLNAKINNQSIEPNMNVEE